ncbi:SMC-Scp complex subunit ScpB [Sporosarcina siberiensis]|uniref:Segregation and condensation protein B n=1 Tax=Sporosarcina siberiensis TaxID=1365606 RepID=A0ABW4SHG1_9BACL
MENRDRVIGMLESFLFIAGNEGLTVSQLKALTDLEESEILLYLETLLSNYEQRMDSGITLKLFSGAYQLVTKAEYANDIKRLLENPAPQSITKASLEVLAIIAYKQPVTRVEIDDLRGVKSDGPIHTLISRGFIMENGRSEGTGRAILYGTTDVFLDRFGLSSLESLPPLMLEQDNVQEDTDLFMTQFQEVFGEKE